LDNRVFGNQKLVRDWIQQGLPNDPTSVDNSILLQNNNWPMLVDTEGLVSKWVRTMESKVQIYVLNQKKENFTNFVKKAMKYGFSVLVEVIIVCAFTIRDFAYYFRTWDWCWTPSSISSWTGTSRPRRRAA